MAQWLTFRLFITSLFIGISGAWAQNFVNPDLNGIVCTNCTPTSWYQVPFTEPFCMATTALLATVDNFDMTGPNQPGGQNGNPFSGATFCSGLHADLGGGNGVLHEGLGQIVNGLTPGTTYSVCFYQAVVKQQNCLDESGSWAVYLDNALTYTSPVSTSNLVFNSNSLVWDQRSFTFTATAASHEFDFLPIDDDPNILTDLVDITGALRMGIDLIELSVQANATITAAGPFCLSDPAVNLTAATAGGTWSGNGITNASTGTFDPAVAGIGSHVITYDIGGGLCGATDNITIDVTSTGNAGWTAPVIPLCEGDAPINLDALITGDLGGTWSGTGVTGSQFDPSGLTGLISVTYTVGGGACAGTSTQDIGVVNISANATSTDISCNGANDGTANVTPSGGLTYSYSWNTTPVQTTASISNLAAGTYTVTVTEDASGCTTTATVTITEPGPLTAVGQTSPTCGTTGSAEVIPSGGASPYTYLWTPTGGTGNIETGLPPGINNCVVTDASGCTVSVDVDVIAIPLPVVTVSNDTTIGFGESIRINAYGATSYLWDPDFNLTCADCDDPIATVTETTTYCVTGNDGACSDTACVKITIEIDCGDVFVPTAFSPNYDSNNDLVCVYGNCLSSFVLNIYNRWGEKVFETSDTSICWDGTWKGKELNSAVFVFRLQGQLISGEEVNLKGNISLIR